MAAGQYSREQVLELVLSDNDSDENEDICNGSDEEFGLLEEEVLGHGDDDTPIEDDRNMEHDEMIENDDEIVDDGIMFDEMVYIEDILEDMNVSLEMDDLMNNGNDMDEDDYEGDAESDYDTDENDDENETIVKGKIGQKNKSGLE